MILIATNGLHLLTSDTLPESDRTLFYPVEFLVTRSRTVIIH